MKDILDHDQEEDPENTTAKQAFILFKWIAVFIVAGLMVHFYQLKWSMRVEAAQLLTGLFLLIATLLSFPAIAFSIRSWQDNHRLSYQNLIPFLTGLGTILFFLYLLIQHLPGLFLLNTN